MAAQFTQIAGAYQRHWSDALLPASRQLVDSLPLAPARSVLEVGAGVGALYPKLAPHARIPLMTYVTCPILRYHPAVVAQKAATMQLLSDGRFTLGLGAGENLNEHIVGGRWPLAGVRHEMLEEAVEIIRALWAGGTVTYRGKHFDVESAKVWDLPDTLPPIGIAVSGPASCRLAGRHAYAMIAVEPLDKLGQMFDQAGGSGKPRIGQIALSYDPDQRIASKRAMDQFRWFTGGWRVNAELPVPASFEVASRMVREEDVSTQMPCGPDIGRHVAGVREFEAAGFRSRSRRQVGRTRRTPRSRQAHWHRISERSGHQCMRPSPTAKAHSLETSSHRMSASSDRPTAAKQWVARRSAAGRPSGVVPRRYERWCRRRGLRRKDSQTMRR